MVHFYTRRMEVQVDHIKLRINRTAEATLAEISTNTSDYDFESTYYNYCGYIVIFYDIINGTCIFLYLLLHLVVYDIYWVANYVQLIVNDIIERYLC